MTFTCNGRIWDTEKKYYVACYRFRRFERFEEFCNATFEKIHYYPVKDTEFDTWRYKPEQFVCCEAGIDEVNFYRDNGKMICSNLDLNGIFGKENILNFFIIEENEDDVKKKFTALMKQHRRICNICEQQIDDKKAVFCSHCGAKLNYGTEEKDYWNLDGLHGHSLSN